MLSAPTVAAARMSVAAATSAATKNGINVRPAAYYARTIRSIKPCATSESEKRAKAAAVRRVSVHVKAPEPSITRTTCARKMIMSATVGSDQKTTCRAAVPTWEIKALRSPLARAAASVGNAATEYEAPMIERGTACKLNAKVKIAIEPGAS